MRVLANAHAKPYDVLFSDLGGEVVARGKDVAKYPYVVLFLKEKTQATLVLLVRNAYQIETQLRQRGWTPTVPGTSPISKPGELLKRVAEDQFLSEMQSLEEMGVALKREDRIFPYYLRVTGRSPDLVWKE